MDNVVAPDDPQPGSNVTSYSFGLQRPATGKYVLHIKSSRRGSFDLEIDTTTSSSTSSAQDGLAQLNNVPTYPGSSACPTSALTSGGKDLRSFSDEPTHLKELTNQPRKCRSDTIMARILAEQTESSFAPSH
jgi:hypothetical protein